MSKKIFYFGTYKNFIDFSNKYKERVGWENIYYTPFFPCSPVYIRSSFEREKTILIPLEKTIEIHKGLNIELSDIILIYSSIFGEEDRFKINPIVTQLAEVIAPWQIDNCLDKYFAPVKIETPSRFSLMEIE
jgi:hypothetical protein